MSHYTTEQLASFPWIVSTDTLRPDHLADAYLGAFDRLGQDIPEPFKSDLQQAAAYASYPVGPTPCDAWDVALGWAFDRLNERAPVGFYFGASEGDGACFGFWLSEDWADALDHCGIAADADPATLVPIIRELTDIGVDPDNVEDTFQGETEGYNDTEAGAAFAAQLAEDIGAWDGKASWPCQYIDWEAAWDDLVTGDGFSLVRVSHARWLVFRPV